MLNSCGGFADPKSYADAYSKCMEAEGDELGVTKEGKDKCFKKVNGEVGKLKRRIGLYSWNTSRKHLVQTH